MDPDTTSDSSDLAGELSRALLDTTVDGSQNDPTSAAQAEDGQAEDGSLSPTLKISESEQHLSPQSLSPTLKISESEQHVSPQSTLPPGSLHGSPHGSSQASPQESPSSRRGQAVRASEAGARRRREAAFQQRLTALLGAGEDARNFAAKLYARFGGDPAQLPRVLQLLEDRWGFPERLFPLLWTQLRRAAFRHRGEQVRLCKVMEEEVPERIEQPEWVDGFLKFLQALRARCGQARVSRRGLVRQHGATPRSMEKEYFQGPKIGEGAFGEVFRVYHRKLGVERVVKVIPKDQLTVAERTAADEVNALKTLDHPHIVRIYEAFEMSGSLHVVMDYAEGGDLGSLLDDLQVAGKLVPEGWARTVTHQMCSALEYMHFKGLIHCDLKPANTMLLRPVDPLANEAAHVLLVDFGIAEMCQERSISGSAKVKGTPYYLAPEAFDGNYSEKSDMWALGVILFEMLQGQRPFQGNGPNILMLWNRVAVSEPQYDGIAPLAQQVVKGLLAKDPINRLTAKECRAEEWFAIGAPLKQVHREQARSSLKAIGHVNYFRRAAMFAVATGLSMKDMEHLFDIFKRLDWDETGSLSLEQFAKGLEIAGIKQDPESLMAILDLDQNGSISYTEFLAGVLGTNSEEELSESAVREAFEMFDLDGDGSISAQELRVVLSGDGPLVEVLPDGHTIEDIMEQVGEDGRISFESFMAYLRDADSSPSTSPVRRKHKASGRFASEMMKDLDGEVPCTPSSPLSPVSVRRDSIASNVSRRGRRRSSAHYAPEAPNASSQIILPPLHEWLLEACGEPLEREALRRLLNYPGEVVDQEFVSEHLYSISRHFLACIALFRQLSQHPAADQDEALRAAVAAAAATHTAQKRRPSACPPAPGRPASGPQPRRAGPARGSRAATPLRAARKGSVQPRQGQGRGGYPGKLTPLETPEPEEDVRLSPLFWKPTPTAAEKAARRRSEARPVAGVPARRNSEARAGAAVVTRAERRKSSKSSDVAGLPRLPPAAGGTPARGSVGAKAAVLPGIGSRRPREPRRQNDRLPLI